MKLSSQVKQAVVEVEEYIRREGWPAVPSDIMKVRLLSPLHQKCMGYAIRACFCVEFVHV